MSSYNPYEFLLSVANSSLGALVGRQLECIHVREDELVFSIYGATLTSRTDVYYRKDGKTTRRGQDSWIDMLCTCIHQDIVSAEQPHDTDIVITFEDQSQMFFSLREKDRLGTPAVQLEINHGW